MKSRIAYIPRDLDESEVSWIYKTRKYISIFQAREIYDIKYGVSDYQKITATKYCEAIDGSESELLLTALYSAPLYDVNDIIDYINIDSLKSLALALAIEFNKFDIVVKYGDESDVILYLENVIIDDNDIKLLDDNDDKTLVAISSRIVDGNKVRYNLLMNNFTNILKAYKQKYSFIINQKYIRTYIENSKIYSDDKCLEFILESYPDVHPDFKILDSLSWDPFTKSRRFSHWLNVKNRMDELSRYYFDISGKSEIITSNKEYISDYSEFISKFGR
ncbi:hypothetical protein AB4151_14830 [Vibrio splendidus]